MHADVAFLSPLMSQLRKLRGYTVIGVPAAIYIFATLGGITIMRIGDMNTAALITEANNPDQTIPPPIVTLSRPSRWRDLPSWPKQVLDGHGYFSGLHQGGSILRQWNDSWRGRRQNSGKLKMQVGSFGLLLYNHN